MKSLLESKNIAPLWDRVCSMNDWLKKGGGEFCYDKGINIKIELDSIQTNHINNLAKDLKSWRKGPFRINDLFIDSEWRSFIKWDLLAPYINLENKRIADVGCNNGFYMFAAQTMNPKEIIGFDPSGLYYCQFHFINHLLNLPIKYELLGVQDLPKYARTFGEFDVVFCMGVLYHRSDVFVTLKQLAQGIKKNGELILDTLIVESSDFNIDSSVEFVLSPKESYAKMSNVFLIPNLSALNGWLNRCGFKDIALLEIKETSTDEQRKTEWITGLSLDSFVESNKTIEGYPAPKRAYIKAIRK